MNVASQKTLQQKEWATIDSAEWENMDWNSIEASYFIQSYQNSFLEQMTLQLQV